MYVRIVNSAMVNMINLHKLYASPVRLPIVWTAYPLIHALNVIMEIGWYYQEE